MIVVSLIFHIFVSYLNASSNYIIIGNMKWIKWLVASMAASLMFFACEQQKPEEDVVVKKNGQAILIH